MSNKLIKESNVKKQHNSKVSIKTLYAILMIIIPVCVFYLQEFMLRNPFEKMKWQIQCLNIMFWEVLLLALIAVVGRLRIAIWLECFFAIVVGVLNYYVIAFRAAPFQPWDIKSARVAMSVAGDYDYSMKPVTIICIVGLLLICVGAYFIRLQLPRFVPKNFDIRHISTWKVKGKDNIRRFFTRFAVCICAIAMLVGYILFVQQDSTVKKFGIYDKLFTPLTMTYKDGTPVAFIIETKFMNVKKPAGYSDTKAADLLSQYTEYTEGGTDESAVKPNIIVIMNEAFSDLSILQPYETNEDEMPFVRSLLAGHENTVSGYMDVSVLGGNTANTEFEFLTGDSMAWLPQGSIPYQQYVSRPTESMASVLKNQGYSTIALHPYKPKGWNRDKVYEYFGFDAFYSENDFDNPERIRDYISDTADYEKVISLFENKQEDKPLFLFNVTMQNHSSYTDEYDNFVPEISVDGIDNIATIQYLSLIKRSDMAFEQLINYFETCDEPVIVVFFGDHQPTDSVVAPLYKHNDNSVYELDDVGKIDRYKVPFVVWSNMNIEEETNVTISPNLLGAKVMDIANVSLSPYEFYLRKLNADYDSISVMQVTDSNGNVTSAEDSQTDLEEYRLLQYYHLFAK
ncbi:MAG: LTA synthase family protein [Lachnospiraceae bacterium]|nr:LTA synthase family protein [Candidatus Colinaster equi]